MMRSISLLLATLLVLPFLASASTYGFYSANSHYYLLVTSPTPIVNYTTATALANAQWLNNQQGYLVTVNDGNESSYVLNYVASQLAPAATAPTAWIGTKKTGTSWNWYAIGGRVSTVFYDQNSGCQTGNTQYCNWITPPPAAAGCAQIYLASNSNNPPVGKWVGVDCTNAPTFYIVVEFDTPSGSTCSPGFSYSGGACRDNNECTAAGGSTLCPSGYRCMNTIGSYNCTDIDECTETPNICGNGYTCANTPGSNTCTDVNECAATPGPCPSGQACTNTPGSYSCAAAQGYYTCTITNTPSYFYIQSVLNGLVVDLHSSTAGDTLVMAVAADTVSQKWSFTAEGVFINAKNGYVIDIKGTDTAIDTPIVAWYQKASGNNINQKWRYDSSTNLIWSQAAPNRLLDVRDVSTDIGAPLCLYSLKSDNTLNQQWYLSSAQSGLPTSPPTAAPTTAAPVGTTTTTTTTTTKAPVGPTTSTIPPYSVRK